MRGALWLQMALGVAALIGGLQIAGRALHDRQAGRADKWLSRATGHPMGGVLTGLFATVLIHSSSVATIATVGLVDAQALTLEQAAGVIVGANLGTTLSAHMLAWRPGPWLPFAVGLAGVTLLALRRRRSGLALLGAGLALQGLLWIDGVSAALGAQAWFSTAMVVLAASPWLGVAVGAVLTTLVLSSTLTIGILQRIASQGLVPPAAALPILFGSNIGTTADTLLASVGMRRDAQRAAVFHLLFNVLGTVLFLCALPQAVAAVRAWSDDPARQIAVAHTLFNAVTAMLVLPCRHWLIALTRAILPD